MFKAVMSDAKLLKDIIVAIATLIDEGTFEITSEAINLREMDPSRVAMVDFQWSKSLFDEYNCSQPTKICINITEMLKLLKRAGKGDSVELTLDEEKRRLNIKLRGKYVRTFSMPILEAAVEEVPTPKITFNVKAKITTDGIKEAIEDAALVSDHVSIEANEEELIMRAEGDIMGATIEMRKGEGALLDLEVKEPSKATFSLSYLSDIIKAASATSEISTIEFSTDMPIKIDFPIREGKLTYFLAPRIEA